MFVSSAAKPAITSQPQSQQVVYGHEFSLSVAVESPTNDCILQWYKNYARLHGKNDPRLTVKSAVDSDSGEYYCMAANRGGSVDSDIAFVRVINPHAPHHPSAAGAVNPLASHSYPNASQHPSAVVNPYVPHHLSAAGVMNPHTSIMDPDHQAARTAGGQGLPSWSGPGVQRSYQWQTAGTGGLHSSIGGVRQEDLIGRGFLDDAQPMSLTASIPEHFGGGVGGSGFSSLRFPLRRGSGTTSTGKKSVVACSYVAV